MPENFKKFVSTVISENKHNNIKFIYDDELIEIKFIDIAFSLYIIMDDKKVYNYVNDKYNIIGYFLVNIDYYISEIRKWIDLYYTKINLNYKFEYDKLKDTLIKYPKIYITHPLLFEYTEIEYIYSDYNGLVYDNNDNLIEDWTSEENYNIIRSLHKGNWKTDWQFYILDKKERE